MAKWHWDLEDREQLRRSQAAFSWVTEQYDKIPVERIITGDGALPGTMLRLPIVYGLGDPLHRFFATLKRMDDGRAATRSRNAHALEKFTVLTVGCRILPQMSARRRALRKVTVPGQLDTRLGQCKYFPSDVVTAGWSRVFEVHDVGIEPMLGWRFLLPQAAYIGK